MTTELAPRNSAEPNLAAPVIGALLMRDVLAPRNVAEAMELARTFHKSGMYQVQSAEQAFVILSMGMELGLSVTQAFRNISVIKGKPSPSADLLAALVKSSPACIYFKLIESTAEIATYETHRHGEDPIRMSFTMKQAATAGLLSSDNSNWKKYPEAMLRARASAALARAVYQDVCAGMYIPDEIEAIDITPRREMGTEQAALAPASPPVQVSPADKAERTALKKAIHALIETQPEDEREGLYQGILDEYGKEVNALSLTQARNCKGRLEKAFAKPADLRSAVTAKAGVPSDRAAGEGYVSENAKPNDDPFDED